MTTLLVDRPGSRHADAAQPGHLFDGVSGGPTLDDVVSSAWEGLTAHAPVECPLCGGEMSPSYSAGAGVAGGRCRSCGSALG